MANKTWHDVHEEQLGRGDRIAVRVNDTIGSMKFIVYSTIVIIFWIILNIVAVVHHWDPYPFILLNLCFSAFAFYASPLILLAGNLAAKRDKVQAQHQFDHQEQELKSNTAMTADIKELTEEIHKHLGIKPKDEN